MTRQTSSTPARAASPWDSAALAQVREWDPVWVDPCIKFSDSPWASNILSCKEVELISLAVNAACTTLSAGGTRRHIRGALEAGASRDEILMILRSRPYWRSIPAARAPPSCWRKRKRPV